MPIKFSELYHYLFDAKSIITIPDKFPKDEDKRRAYIENRKNEIKKVFAHLDGNNELKEKFYYVLTTLNSASSLTLLDHLWSPEEQQLMNEKLATIDKSEGNYGFAIDDDAIKLKFQELNKELKYFNNQAADQAEKDFIVVYKACKLVTDFVEKNPSSDEDIPFDRAYKMLVLVGAAHGKGQSLFSYINAYFNEHVKDCDNPLQETFRLDIPINDPPLSDLPGWQAFIQTYGKNGVEYFGDAQKIEELNSNKSHAPKTKNEADEISAKISYKRASENPLLAKICRQFHKSEQIFDKCLEVYKLRKTKDNLPDIVIDGKEVEIVVDNQPVKLSGYFILKLPIDDPIAFFLGDQTNCCQSAGGNSEQCVFDGIQRENNGFYVMLKGKPNLTRTPTGGIDYKNFTIVGQGYAWLSEHKNMTFDSWENLRPESDDAIAAALLVEFGKVATKTTDIVQLTIGTGGKTPKDLFPIKVKRPELMAEGYSYGDANKQRLVHRNESKKNAFEAKLKDNLASKIQGYDEEYKKILGENYKDELIEFIENAEITSETDFQRFRQLLFEGGIFFGNPGNGKINLPILYSLINNPDTTTENQDSDEEDKNSDNAEEDENSVDINPGIDHANLYSLLAILSDNNMLDTGTISAIAANRNVFDEIFFGIDILSKKRILNNDNVNLIISNLKDNSNLFEVLSDLPRLTDFLDSENLLSILKDSSFIKNYATQKVLQAMDFLDVLTPENYRLLEDRVNYMMRENYGYSADYVLNEIYGLLCDYVNDISPDDEYFEFIFPILLNGGMLEFGENYRNLKALKVNGLTPEFFKEAFDSNVDNYGLLVGLNILLSNNVVMSFDDISKSLILKFNNLDYEIRLNCNYFHKARFNFRVFFSMVQLSEHKNSNGNKILTDEIADLMISTNWQSIFEIDNFANALIFLHDSGKEITPRIIEALKHNLSYSKEMANFIVDCSKRNITPYFDDLIKNIGNDEFRNTLSNFIAHDCLSDASFYLLCDNTSLAAKIYDAITNSAAIQSISPENPFSSFGDEDPFASSSQTQDDESPFNTQTSQLTGVDLMLKQIFGSGIAGLIVPTLNHYQCTESEMIDKIALLVSNNIIDSSGNITHKYHEILFTENILRLDYVDLAIKLKQCGIYDKNHLLAPQMQVLIIDANGNYDYNMLDNLVKLNQAKLVSENLINLIANSNDRGTEITTLLSSLIDLSEQLKKAQPAPLKGASGMFSRPTISQTVQREAVNALLKSFSDQESTFTDVQYNALTKGKSADLIKKFHHILPQPFLEKEVAVSPSPVKPENSSSS